MSQESLVIEQDQGVQFTMQCNNATAELPSARMRLGSRNLGGIALAVTVLFAFVAAQATSQSRQLEAGSAKALAILEKNCISCHSGPSPQGGVALASRKTALASRGGKPVIAPGAPERSLLLSAVSGKGAVKMPPGGCLSVEEVDTLRTWIKAGAPWPKQGGETGLWSLRPVKPTTPPRVSNPAWQRNPIDAFIFDQLKKQGLRPNPLADGRNLIRRVTFDLLGVPPSPSEVSQFLDDKEEGAFERLVDRLLADARYGERWARHWLDCARFAESHGFEYDRIRDHAWRYRDYVIESLNADKPYNQFVREQIAGDLLSPQTRAGIVATGFLVAGPWDEVAHNIGNNIPLMVRAREDELEDAISVVGQTVLGLTINCARCHDHKFDPITQRDYYRLRASIAGLEHGNRPLLTLDEEKARRAEVERLKGVIDGCESALRANERRAREKLAPWPTNLPRPIARWTFDLGSSDLEGNAATELVGGAVISGGRLILKGAKSFARTGIIPRGLQAKTLEAWVRLDNLQQRGGAVISLCTEAGERFDSITFGERQPGKWIAGTDGFQRTRDLRAPLETASPGDTIHIAVTFASDGTVALYRNGEPYGESYRQGAALELKSNTYRMLIGLRHPSAGNGYLSGQVDEARVYDRALTAEEAKASFRAGAASLSEDAIEQALKGTTHFDMRQTRLDQLLAFAELNQLEQVQLAYCGVAKQPKPSHILKRGDVDQPADEVTPGGITAVGGGADFGLPATAPEAAGRLKLAQWLTDRRNPLTARVIVNRVWHYHFGRGIVGTPNDFGANGEKPSHPELLDWLADRFTAPVTSPGGMGWSLKALHKLILTSHSYRQASAANSIGLKKDAGNRWLWRFEPKRLEAEVVRDSLLAISGSLNDTKGGPSYRPFNVKVFGSNFYEPLEEDKPEFLRRSIYRMVINSSRNTLLDALDCPDPSTKTPVRALTTTPVQAMEMMNNPFVIRQADALARRIIRDAGDSPASKVKLVFELAFGRPPTSKERPAAEELVRLGKLSSLCWALVNANEFLVVR